jgi:serine/threonine-protein kinase HipA
MMTNLSLLNVFLNDEKVGGITQLAQDQIMFQFDERYLNELNPPVLSQSFLDSLGQPIQQQRITRTKAPPFFSNLLPEGHMRTYLAEQAGVRSVRDFALLHLLGADLPGAIQIQVSEEQARFMPNSEAQTIHDDEEDASILKFSLAGVQLKFSALMNAPAGLTIPSHGRGGEWIVKLPS